MKFAACLLFLNPVLAIAQCCGQASIVNASPIVEARGSYEWKRLPSQHDPNFKPIFCVKDGIVVGTFQFDKYYPYNARLQTYGVPCNPPIPMDVSTAKVIEAFESATPRIIDGKSVADFGVDNSHMSAKGEGKVPPDDTKKWRLTVRSEDKAIIESVRQAVEPFKDKVLFQSYPPGHWALEPGLDFGVVHLETPPREDGKAVLVSTIRDSSDLGNRVATTLRKADPSFSANAVPDTSKAFSLDDVLAWLKSPSPAGGLPWGLVLGGAAFVYYQLRKSGKV